MKAISSVLFVVACAVAGMSRSAGAQGRADSASVGMSFDASYAIGSGSGIPGDPNNSASAYRFSLDVDQWRRRHVGVYGSVGVDIGRANAGGFCNPGGFGGCGPGLPAFSGLNALAGVMVGKPDTVEIRAAVGPGAFQGGDADVILGAVIAQADASVFLNPHFAALAGAHLMTLAYNHDRLCIRTINVGIRIH